MALLYYLMALLAGAASPTQLGVNSVLRLRTGRPEWAALISFMVGTLALAAYILVLRLSLPGRSSLLRGPWWIWTGGFLGAFMVLAGILLGYRLGAATTIAFIIAGQMGASIALDHFGLLGFPLHRAGALRILGAALVITGVVLIRRF